MHSVSVKVLYTISIWVTIDTIFLVSASFETKSSIEKPASEVISDKYGLRSNLLSCLTKLSKPNEIDCQGRDKGCCLLIKLSRQRKNVIHNVKQSVTTNEPKEIANWKKKEKYRNFWDEDQKFDFPRIIQSKQLENKNDIIQIAADGKSVFKNSIHSSFAEKKKPTGSSSRYGEKQLNNNNVGGGQMVYSNPIDRSPAINRIDDISHTIDDLSNANFKRNNKINNYDKEQDTAGDRIFLKWALEKRKKQYNRENKGGSENSFLRGNFDQANADPVVDSSTEFKRDHTHMNPGFISLSKYSPDNNNENNKQTLNENQMLFKGGQRRGVILEKKKMSNEVSDLESSESKKKNIFDSLANFLKKKRKTKLKKKLGYHHGKKDEFAYQDIPFTARYDRQHCATLKVPCRFVSDHACCRFKMPLDLVARSRSMDGSADLKWRNADHSLAYNIGGPRSGAQGRSLDWSSMNAGRKKNGSRNSQVMHLSKFSSNITPRNIKYNFSNSKYSVSIPRYFYNGGPIQIKNLLATCWRLHYLKCPGKIWQSSMSKNGVEDKVKEHPCCKLVSRPVKESFPSNRISRWLS